jgi:hypothetical protein
MRRFTSTHDLLTHRGNSTSVQTIYHFPEAAASIAVA